MATFVNKLKILVICLLVQTYLTQDITPVQVHIAFAGDSAHTIAISFTTFSTIQDYVPEVIYGKQPSSYDNVMQGKTTQYYKSYQHNVVIKDLEPETTYYYKVGVMSKYSEEFNFTTNAKNGRPFTIGVLGDVGVNSSQNTIDRIYKMAHKYEFIQHVGDISYADDVCMWPFYPNSGTCSVQGYEDVYDLYLKSVEKLAAHKAYMVLPGNHEASCTEFLDFRCIDQHKNFTPYNHRFRMPSQESGAFSQENINMWYSYDVYNAHLVSISTETDYPNAPNMPNNWFFPKGGNFGDQLGWLKKDLEKAKNNSNIKWIIVFGHRPIYSSQESDFTVGSRQRLQDTFEDLFNEYGVDLYISGHQHFYERMWPINKNKVTQTNYNNLTTFVQLIQGAGGSNEGQQAQGSSKQLVANGNYEKFGHSELQIFNETTLRWNYIQADDGVVTDEFYLHKQ